jgi:hypothetical protein
MESGPDLQAGVLRLQTLRRFVVPCLRVASALLLILSIVHMLEGLLTWTRLGGSLRTAPERPVIDKVRQEPNSTLVTIVGRYKPDVPFVVKVNQRAVGTWDPSDGQFSIPVQISRQLNIIQVIPYDIGTNKIKTEDSASVAVVYDAIPPTPPVVILVTDATENKKLIVGAADAQSHVIVTDSKGTRVADTFSDNYGAFALLMPNNVTARPVGYLLTATSQAHSSDSSTPVDLDRALAGAAPGMISRSLCLAVSPTLGQLKLTATAPPQLPQIRELIEGDINAYDFVSQIFGNLPYAKDFQSSVEIDDTGGAAHVTITAETDPEHFVLASSPQGVGQWPLLTVSDSLTIDFGDTRPQWQTPEPNLIVGTKSIWKGPLSFIEVRSLSATLNPIESQDSSEKTRERPTFKQLSSELQLPPLAESLAYSLVGIVPFVWILWIIRSDKDFLVLGSLQPNQLRRRTTAACLTLAALGSWYFFYWLSFDLQRDPIGVLFGRERGLWSNIDFNLAFYAIWLSVLATIPIVTRPLEDTAQWLEWPTAASDASPVWKRVLSWLANAGFVAFALFLLVVILGSSAKPYNSALEALLICLLVGRFLGLRLGLGLCGVFLSAAILSTFSNNGLSTDIAVSSMKPFHILSLWLSDLSKGRFGNLFIALVLYLLLTALFYWITGVRLVGRRVLQRPSRLLFVLMSAILLPILVLYRGGLAVRLTAILPILTSIWMLLYIVEVSLPQALSATRAGRWRLWTAIAVLFAFIVLLPQTRGSFEVTIADLFPLLSGMNGLYKYIPMIAILAWLRSKKPKTTGALAPEEMALGCFMFSVYLVGYTATWLQIPVPLIVGYLLARFWLFIPDQVGLFEGDKKAALKRIIASQWGENVLAAFKKAQRKKLEEGEVAIPQYLKQVDEMKNDLGLAEDLTASKFLLLGNGPASTDWGNASIAAKYAFALALGPTVLTMYEYANSTQPALFPALLFVLRISLAFAFWLLLAVFFGYFFRHIRGNSGLTKGLGLSIAITVPFLCLNVLDARSLSELHSFLIWAGEIFAYCTVLGLLAFDFELLRENGFALRNLPALHNVPTLSAFASSLTAALLPAILAIVQGRIVDLVKFWAKFIVPQVPVGR